MKKAMMTLVTAAAVSFGVFAATETVDGIPWTYTVANGCASVGGGQYYSTAIPTSTSGEITIPSTLGGCPVTDIGPYAFYHCESLTAVVIPEGITRIKYDAFHSCISLTSVTIPEGVTSIESRAFEGLSSLTNAVIPDSVTDIANDAFSGCNDALYDVQTIPGVKLVDGWVIAPTDTSISGELDLNGVRGIGGGAFRYCSNLKSVVLPDGVTRICGETFYSCGSLTNATIPASVTSIGYNAFLYCRNLLNVTIPDSVASVGSDAFGASGLRSVTIPASLTNIGFRVFSGCGGLQEIKVDEGNIAFSSENGLLLSKDGTTLIEGVNGEVSIPYSVISIGNNAFSGRTSLTHVMIPDSVTNIASGAFSSCSGLTRITIPDSVTAIGYSAFSYCSGLTRVVIPYSVTSIGHEAFAKCRKLTEIEVSESNPVYSSKNGLLLSKDGRALLQGVNGNVTIPNSVMAIGYKAFYGCGGLTQVVIPNSVTNIEESAFTDCYELTSVTIGNGVTHIGRQAFQGCDNLTAVHVSDLEAWCSIWFGEIWGEYWDYELKKMVVDGQMDVEANPLYYAHNLYVNGRLVTNLELPEDMPYWGACAFAGCSSLRRVTIPDSIKAIGTAAFYECTGLTSVSVPETVISIGPRAFYGCSGLTEVAIGNGVTNIWEEAFFGCDRLTNITIPESIMNIGADAFSDCGGLMRIVLLGNAPSTYGSVFNGVGIGCRVYVTEASTGWGVDIPGVWQGLPIDYSTFVLEDGALILATTGEETDVTIPNTVTRIGANAFSRCGDLERVTIPDSVEAIAPTAFDGCEKLWAKWFKTLERLSGDETVAGAGDKILLSVTNVVVHYVTASVPSEAVTVPTTMGIVNIITEVSAGSAVAISSEWATQYPNFTEKFGNDFTAAVTMTTGKRDCSGNLMRVWQDYVAGTDPTDEDDVFKASITFDKDGKPIISWTPELTEVEAAKRKYTTYGKVKLTDDWVEVPDGRERDYNFFKVTVQMR